MTRVWRAVPAVSTATTLLLIRHAQPEDREGAYPQRLSGWHDVALGAVGRREAALLARKLRDENLGAIYASPLRRAAETATTIAEWTGLPVTHLPHLKEINCGEIDGQRLEHVQLSYPALWDENLRQQNPEFRWPGGESYNEFRTRCLAGVAQIAARHDGEQVAVVTHAGVISQLIGHIRGVSPARWNVFRPGTASLTVLEWRDGSGTLAAFDDLAHLARHDLHGTTRTEHQPE